jgi:DNA-binding response OmpR family regulator
MVRAIRSTESGKDVPIILMSAARDVARDTTIGHDLFLAKPFDLGEFLGHVERLKDTHGGRDGTRRNPS